MKPSDAKKEILESIDAIQKVKGKVLNSSKDYKHQIYLEPLVKSFSKDKLETKLNRAKYNVIPISDLTKRIKETRENKNKKEKNKKKYIDISVWVNVGSGVCADDEAKAEDVETEIGVFDDDKVKAEERIDELRENKNKKEKNKKKYIDVSIGVNAKSGVCADDEAKADEVDTEIGDCAADDEATDKLETKLNRAKYNVIPISDLTKRIKETRENKNKKEKNKKKYIDISVWVNAGSGVCANDEAKAEDVETKIGVFDDDKVKAEEVENSADDEAKADEVDIEIGDCAADDEATDKLETKLNRAKYNVIPISDLTKRIKEMRENKNNKEKNKKKYINIYVWVNAGSSVCADDEAKAEDVETKIGVFDDDKVKAEEVENSADDEAKADEIDIEIGDCATDDEATVKEIDTKIGVFLVIMAPPNTNLSGILKRVNTESGVCADDEAKADEVDIEIGDCAADDEATAKEIDTKIGVFDYNGTSKHQSQWDFEKLRGVIQSTPKTWELWCKGTPLELMDNQMPQSSADADVALRCIQIGLLCVQENAKERPRMSSVLHMLENENFALPEPNKPPFAADQAPQQSALDAEVGSIN
ncbi:hypothetical protein LWI29_024905 [Acer saccharum]|uniref:Uncharacterized protein n=1 Tax=Acer saccharum TaxID=4024 RepID=A0AA39S1R0_ACESA|nr:hypothetical protein LWI29_024905 [Acer saccharum]